MAASEPPSPLLELPPPLLIACLQPLNSRSLAAAACTCRALAAAAGDHALWCNVLARKWDVPRGLVIARAEHLRRKRALAVMGVLANIGHVHLALLDAPIVAETARTLLCVACCSERFERSHATLVDADALSWLLCAALVTVQGMQTPVSGHLAEQVEARVATYAALGATAVRFGELSDEKYARFTGVLIPAMHRVTSVLAQRSGGEAAATLCACAALAVAPLCGAVPGPARVPAAGPCPAGARQPHESVRARVFREMRGGGFHLLSGSWGGRRLCSPRTFREDNQTAELPTALELSLGLSVQDDGRVSGFGHDGLGDFDVVGTVTRTQMPLPELHARVSLRVTYRSCGWLPGALAEHTVPGAAPQAWEGFVWPFGLVGAWAPEAPRAQGGTPQWVDGGTFILWPKCS